MSDLKWEQCYERNHHYVTQLNLYSLCLSRYYKLFDWRINNLVSVQNTAFSFRGGAQRDHKYRYRN